MSQVYKWAIKEIEYAYKTRAIKLDLSNWGLNRLPPELKKLTYLRELCLTKNNLKALPKEVVSLPRLVKLDISKNQLTSLPKSIGRLSNLGALNVRYNQLKLLPDSIGKLTKLSGLNLNNNYLESLPKEIKGLVNLKRLYLNDNKLKSLPREIGKLSNLLWLSLGNNSLTTLPKEIGMLARLKELVLKGNQLESLPKEIGQLNELTKLVLAHNKLKALPSEIEGLVELKQLFLRKNQLKRLPPEVGKLSKLLKLSLSENKLITLPLEVEKLTHLTGLHLSSNRLVTLPVGINKLTRLTTLSANRNQISSLPIELGKLTQLSRLHLMRNRLNHLPAEIGELDQLKLLDLSFNQISHLPKEIGNLAALERLTLLNNKLSRIPPSLRNLQHLDSNIEGSKFSRGLLLHNNKFSFPEEVYDKPPKELIQYILDWQQDEVQPLHEAKIIFIGTGGVGKTSLVNMLTKGYYNKDELKTEGIEITDWHVRRNKDKIALHIWDFGGQEIMHATHKFFMTKRSIYVLVTNSRIEDRYGDTDIDYWMKLIQSYAGKEVPVIIAINKCETHAIDIGKVTLKNRYKQLVGVIETSCAKDIGIESLKLAIKNSISELPHIDDTIPLTYIDIKNRLVEENREYISYYKYRDLCREIAPRFEDTSMKVLISLLHDLGIMLNFRDEDEGEEIAQTQVLNPDWVTKGVYTIINSPRLIRQGGKVSYKDIREILPENSYPTEKERKLIRMVMRQFELAYKLHDEKAHLIPAALPKDRPLLVLGKGQTLRIRFSYEAMPSSIMSRFIVHTHNMLVGNQLWRNGIVLENRNCQAYVYAVPEDEEMYIEIRGEGRRRDMLAIVLHYFDKIHKSLSAIGAEKEVYVEKYSKGKLRKTWIPYQYLLDAEEDGVGEIYWPPLRVSINVKKVLDGVRTTDFEVNRISKSKGMKVLFLASTPEDASVLRVTKEHREITEAQQLSSYRERFDWRFCGAVRVKDFRRKILQDRPKVVHFAGYGKVGLKEVHSYGMRIEEVGILLEDEDGRKEFVGGRQLKHLFKVFEDTVECVFLNCCYSEGVAEALQAYVPYIVAVKGVVEDETAILFATAFYEGLGEGIGVTKAFGYAKGAIELEDEDGDMFMLFERR